MDVGIFIRKALSLNTIFSVVRRDLKSKNIKDAFYYKSIYGISVRWFGFGLQGFYIGSGFYRSNINKIDKTYQRFRLYTSKYKSYWGSSMGFNVPISKSNWYWDAAATLYIGHQNNFINYKIGISHIFCERRKSIKSKNHERLPWLD